MTKVAMQKTELATLARVDDFILSWQAQANDIYDDTRTERERQEREKATPAKNLGRDEASVASGTQSGTNSCDGGCTDANQS